MLFNMLSLILGIFFLSLGLFTIYLRVFKNNKWLGKIERMREVYGETLGTIVHIISYTVAPIILGIGGIVAYCLGIDFF